MDPFLPIPPGRALALRVPDDYALRFFWASCRGALTLEARTGLPWLRALETASFVFTRELLERDGFREGMDRGALASLEALSRSVPWAWTMLAFGCARIDPSPERAAADLLAFAAGYVARWLGKARSADQLERELAKRLRAAWLLPLEAMRHERRAIMGEFRAISERAGFCWRKPTVTVTLPHGRKDVFFSEAQAFFFPAVVGQDQALSLDRPWEALAKARARDAENAVWQRLPLRIEGFPGRSLLESEADRYSVRQDEAWLRTQVLLAGADAPLGQEAAPWMLEPLLRALRDLPPETLVAKFWDRMEARGPRFSPADRACLAERVRATAVGVLRDAAASAEEALGDDARVAYLVFVRETEAGVRAILPRAGSIVTAEAWLDACFRPGSERERDRADAALKALSPAEFERLLVALEQEIPTDGLGAAERLQDRDFLRETGLPLLRRFADGGAALAEPASIAFANLVDAWDIARRETHPALGGLRDFAAVFHLLGLSPRHGITSQVGALSPEEQPFYAQAYGLLRMFLERSRELAWPHDETDPASVRKAGRAGAQLDAFLAEHRELFARLLWFAAPKPAADPAGWSVAAFAFFERNADPFVPLAAPAEGSAALRSRFAEIVAASFADWQKRQARKPRRPAAPKAGGASAAEPSVPPRSSRSKKRRTPPAPGPPPRSKPKAKASEARGRKR